jgi:spore germination protein KB
MKKEVLPGGQAISIVILFIFGSSLFMGATGKSGNSSWMAILIAISLAVPVMVMYARLQFLYPGKDLFDMLIATFGQIPGRVFSCLYIWYALHLGALVLRNFGEFSRTVALTETPMVVPLLFIGLLCASAVNRGIEVVGKSAKFLLLFSLLVIFVVNLLAIPKYELDHLKPMFASGWPAIFSDALGTFTFPFAEIVLFLGVFRALPSKGSAYKVLLTGLFIAGGLITLISVRNVLVLGSNILSGLYFPSYVAVSRINIGNFITRIEGSSAIIFVTALFVKVSICIYVACRGIAKVFNLKSYRSVVLQVGLIMVYFATFIYKDIFEMQHFAFQTYKIYALPFQVIIPLFLWVAAEILHRRARIRAAAQQ